MSQVDRFFRSFGVVLASIAAIACGSNPLAPRSVSVNASPAREGGSPSVAAQAWGPETPPFNLEVQLRGEGFGLVKFRQPNDDALIVYLDVWVRDLAPQMRYFLQRATDAVVDDNCTGTNWLTLGKGPVAEPIVTDAKGTGRAELFRNLGAFAVGSEFDIHFRVIHEATSAIVLASKCYQFRITQ